MLEGKTLQELAAEVQRQSEARRDFISPASELTLPDTPDPSVSLVRVGGE